MCLPGISLQSMPAPVMLSRSVVVSTMGSAVVSVAVVVVVVVVVRLVFVGRRVVVRLAFVGLAVVVLRVVVGLGDVVRLVVVRACLMSTSMARPFAAASLGSAPRNACFSANVMSENLL